MPVQTRDAQQTTEVVIDRSDALDRYRYTCPRGHTTFSPTNSHLWCGSCRQENEHGADVDPEWYVVYDKKNDEKIPWENVTLAEDQL